MKWANIPFLIFYPIILYKTIEINLYQSVIDQQLLLESIREHTN